jgi:class 3 adenylate cyclase
VDRHAEYKQVTVLFADVVHSMDIAAAVGAERLREIMGGVFRRSSMIVQRYGGTVDKFTGDGIMAVFGAPVALEDHAVRACRAALDIQADAQSLAAEVERRDNVALQLRIGLNSGEVITGEIGSGPMTYTAVGEQVGMAQRMESVAPSGGVMVSDSTARLVDSVAMLGESEQVHIKGAQHTVPAHRLLGMATSRRSDRAEPSFIGRQWEMGALNGVLERSTNGNGSVVGVVGPPGIGKSRIVRELTSRAKDTGVEVFATYCESHTTDLPFHAAGELLREVAGAAGLDAASARAQVRERFLGADNEDLILLDDVLGIGDPDAGLSQIDPDARRRRLAAMVNAAAVARSTPAVYVIEDAHWIDGVSESLLAEFLAVVPQTRTLVLITYRPEYTGALAHAPRSQTIALEPLDDSQMSALSTELMGKDSSVAELVDLVAKRAAGNPFFAEEIVRDLSERDVLIGGRGCYRCADPAANVSVPSTLQAVIAARIDRLTAAAKRTLNAAAVIGSRFAPGMLEALGVDAAVDDLVRAELVDQTAFSPQPEYAFRHPLIRAVAYESQLKSDRAQLHRRLAGTLDQQDQNAALIAEHLEAAGELDAAYAWHMRAGGWSTNRDIAAAQLSWERARLVADALPADVPGRSAMRIAPRTLLCGSAWRRFHPDISSRFDELRELCAEADDKASVAVGMAGMTVEHVLHGQVREASRLASEYVALLESVGDPTLTIGLLFAVVVAKFQTAELAEVLRLASTVVELADGDPTKGNIIMGSPLSAALVWRGTARWVCGRDGWREDLDRGVEMAQRYDPLSLAATIAYKYVTAVPRGALLVDESVLDEIETALAVAERSSDDTALVLLRMTLAVSLFHHGDRERGFTILSELRATCAEHRFALNVLPIFDAYLAREKARRGELEPAVEQLRTLTEDVYETGNLGNADVIVKLFVETLIDRGSGHDLAEAGMVLDRIVAAVPRDYDWVAMNCTVLRLRALLARANGDESYRGLRDRYHTMANDLGFEGHMALAEAMP